jgi:hypothetical protein
MTRIIADRALKEKLGNLTEPAEICDDAGKTLGYFSPFVPPGHELYKKFKSELSDEQLDRIAQEPEEFTTDEVLKHLESL